MTLVRSWQPRAGCLCGQLYFTMLWFAFFQAVHIISVKFETREQAEAYVYRKTGEQRWEQSMSGLPAAKGTTVSRFATHADEPGVIYAANNHGLFRSGDAGRSWKALDLPWPEPGLADGVEALACLPE